MVGRLRPEARWRATLSVVGGSLRICSWIWSRETPVLLALGPEVPWTLQELRRIATVGRARAVHLAVAAAELRDIGRHPDRPIEFYQNILGWYPTTSLVS